MFWNLLIGLAAFALQLILAPKPEDAVPAALDDFDAPTADEGRSIPVIFGTRDVTDPNVVWYGDLSIEDIEGPKQFIFFGDAQIIGYKYSLGVHMVICHGPADWIIDIMVAEEMAWDIPTAGGSIEINKEDLFGGEESEGGIQGTVTIAMGEPTQLQNAYLVEQFTSIVPAFRGVVSIILENVYLGTSAYIKPWKFRVQRIYLTSTGAEQWYPEKAGIPESFEADSTESGLNLDNSGATMNDEGQLDTNGGYAAYGEGGTYTVWSLPDGGAQEITLDDTQGGGQVHITEYGELIVLNGGDIFGSAPIYLEFRDVTDVTNIIQTVDLTDLLDDLGADKLNFGFVAGERISLDGDGGLLIIKLGPSAFEDQPWLVFTRTLTGWDLSDSHVGNIYSGDMFVGGISIGPNYAYGNVFQFGGGDSRVIRIRLDPWLEEEVELSSYITGDVRSLITIGDEVVIIDSGGGIYVFDESLSGVLRSSVGHSIYLGTPVNTGKRMVFGSGFIVAESDAGGVVQHLYEVNIDTLEFVRDILVQETGSVDKDQPYTWMFYNPEAGGLLLGGHFFETVFWTIATTLLDMNPAHIIREILTDGQWGDVTYSAADIDDDSFTFAADQLYSELFGLSFEWVQEEPSNEFIQRVLQHIDAVLYTSRTTGKFVLKLIRNDYDADTIPVITEDDVVEWTEVMRRQPYEATSAVTAQFYDRSQRKDGSHKSTNIAQHHLTGRLNSTTRTYDGICRRDLAAWVADRDLRTLGAGLISGRIMCKRTVETLNPGDPFRLVSSRHELDGQIMRVTELDFGDGRDNKISLKFMQDVFQLGAVSIVDTGTSNWEAPGSPPAPVSPRLVREGAYFDMYNTAGPASTETALAGDADAGFMIAAGSRPTTDTISARILVSEGSTYETKGQLMFGATARLDGAIDAEATIMTLTDMTAVDRLVSVQQLATIKGVDGSLDEIVAVEDVLGADVFISRGNLDTIPRAHSDNAEVVFHGGVTRTDSELRTAGDVIYVKLVTRTPRGTLTPSAAPTDTITFDSRAIRPLRPGAVAFDGDTGFAAFDATSIDPIPVTWARANRLPANKNSWVSEDVTPETGQTTTVTLTKLDGTVQHTYSGIAGTSQDVDVADFGSIASGYIIVSSERDGYESWQSFRRQANLEGPLAGALAVTEADDTLAATGGVAIHGAGAITEGDDTLGSTGGVAIAGASTVTEGDDTLSSTGTVVTVTRGDASITEDDDTVSGAGTVANSANTPEYSYISTTTDVSTVLANAARTFSSISFGTAHTDRQIVVIWSGRTASQATGTPTVTIGGISATQVVGLTGGAGAQIMMFRANVPTTTSGNIVITINQDSTDGVIHVFRIVPRTTAGMLVDSGSNSTTTTSTLVSDIAIVNGGYLICAGIGFIEGLSRSYNGADTPTTRYGSTAINSRDRMAFSVDSTETVGTNDPGFTRGSTSGFGLNVVAAGWD